MCWRNLGIVSLFSFMSFSFEDWENFKKRHPRFQWGLLLVSFAYYAGVKQILEKNGIAPSPFILDCFFILPLITGVILIVLDIIKYLKKPKGSALDGLIIFECVRAKLPKIIGPEGRINTLDTQYSENLKLIGLSLRIGEPGKEWDWPYINECHKCTVRNYAEETAFNITAKIKTSFRDIIKGSIGQKQTGDEIASEEYLIPIPALKGGGTEEFVFYVVNYSQKEFSYSVPQETITIGRIGNKSDITARIGYTSGGAMNVGMGLMPADFSKKCE